MAEKIEVSHRTIVFTVLFILGLWFLWSIKGIILQFLVAVVLMTAFNPVVNRLEKIRLGKHNLPRTAAVVLILLLILGVLGLVVSLVAQPLVAQTTSLVNQLPLILDQLAGRGIDQEMLTRQISQLYALPGDVFKLIGGLFSNILGIFTTLVMALYLLLEREKLHVYLAELVGNQELEKRIEEFIDSLEVTLGGWVRAELLLMLIVGTMTYVGLTLLKVPFAVSLAVIAGLLEIVPNLGPTFSAVPALIVGLAISPLVALGVVTLYVLVQLIENHLIVPQVMSKTVGVNPLITIIALLIGFNLAGVSGAVLAVPMVLIIKSVGGTFWAEKWNRK